MCIRDRATTAELQKIIWDYGEERWAKRIAEFIAVSYTHLDVYKRTAVYLVEDPALKNYRTESYTAAFEKIIKTYKPEIILIGATNIGRDLGPRVAGRVHTGLTADCTKLDIDQETRLLLQTRPAFGGNVMATIQCPDFRPQMATVRPGVMQKAAPDANRTGKIVKVDYDQNTKVRTIVKEVVRESSKVCLLYTSRCV